MNFIAATVLLGGVIAYVGFVHSYYRKQKWECHQYLADRMCDPELSQLLEAFERAPKKGTLLGAQEDQARYG